MKQYAISIETAEQCENGHPQHKIGWRITEKDGSSRENLSTPEQDKLTPPEIVELLRCLSTGTQAILDWHGHILQESYAQNTVCE